MWVLCLLTFDCLSDANQSGHANFRNIGFDLDKMTREFNKHMEFQAQEAAASGSGYTPPHTGIYPLIPQVVPIAREVVTAPAPAPAPAMEVVVEALPQPTPPVVTAYRPSCKLNDMTIN